MSTYDKRRRDGLVAEGLITLEKRGRAKHMVLTDSVYAGAQALLQSELSSKGARKDLAYHALARISGYLEAADVAIADFICPESEAAEPEAPSASPDPRAAVHAGYLRLSEGRTGVRIRIADLRRATAALSREDVDAALLDMLRDKQAHLLPLDDPEERTADDEAHALDIAGEPRHLVYMEGPR